MGKNGVLAEALKKLTPEIIRDFGWAARRRAETVFAKDVVIGQYVRYYEEVMGRKEEGGRRKEECAGSKDRSPLVRTVLATLCASLVRCTDERRRNDEVDADSKDPYNHPKRRHK
jgi:hypothetical protein